MSPLRTLLVAAVALAAGCTAKGTASKAEAPAPAYMFPHSPHVENDVNCLECHKGIETASKLDPAARHVRLTPKASKVCGDCHGEEILKIQAPMRTQTFALNFDHVAHLPRVQGKCITCHQRLPEKGDEEAPAPPMAACTGCHNHRKDFAEARCAACHVDLRKFPLKPVSELTHSGDFKRSHGALARTSAAACANCHDQTHCADCHSPATTPAAPAIRWPEQVEKDFIHRGDFVSRHMIEAGANPASCARCHGTAFCESCHKQQNISAPTAPFASGERDPHPAGWGTGAEHGRAARRNIVVCASCHASNADQVCVMCHRDTNPATSGESRNPHPPGFLKHNDKGDWSTNRVCRTCHG
jgi:hypothetical protein